MAKRHKEESSEPEEEYQFIPPEFDEETFIHKEMVSFHTTAILFLAGIVAALASWGAFAAMDGAKTGWLVGMVILAISFAFLRPLFRLLNVDITHWARREWLGTGFLMFFTWLAFFIMFVNPPISDFADPQINVYVSPVFVDGNGELTVDMFLHDNNGIDKFTFAVAAADGSSVATKANLEKLNGHHYRLSAGNWAPGTYTWTASATDDAGRKTSAEGEIPVANGAITLEGRDLTDRTRSLVVPMPAGVERSDVWAVYADIAGGDVVFFSYDNDVGGYKATSNYLGWSEGTNNITVIMEMKNRFDVSTLVPGGKLTAGPYAVEVASPGTLETAPKKSNPVNAPVRDIPGIGPVMLVAGLVGLAAVARRRLS